MRYDRANLLTRFMLATLVGGTLCAQESGATLHGKVIDDKGHALAGIQVRLESPALFTPRVVTTNDKGEYVSTLLPVGYYTVTATLKGHVPARLKDIRLGLGSNAKVDLRLVPESGATVEVVDSTLEVDKTEVNSTVNFSEETLLGVAESDRTFYGPLDLTAGVVWGSSGNANIRGAGSNFTCFRVNGADVNDELQGQPTASWVIADDVEDVQVALSQVNVRFGRSTGGSVNLVTKTGSNTFSGSIRCNLNPNESDWWANAPGNDRVYQTLTDSLNPTYDVTIRGPIVVDRVWFSLGTTLSPNQSSSQTIPAFNSAANSVMMTGNPATDGTLNAGPGNGYAWTEFGGNQGYIQTQTHEYFEGKVTGAINTDHTVEAAFVQQWTTLNHDDWFGNQGTLAALSPYTYRQRMQTASYRGVLGPATFLEASASRMTDHTNEPTGDPAYGNPFALLVSAGIYSDGAGQAGYNAGTLRPTTIGTSNQPDCRDNRTYKINLKQYLTDGTGTHDLDLGFDYYAYMRRTAFQSGTQNEAINVGGAYANAAGNLLYPAVNWSDWYTNGQNGLSSGPAPVLFHYLGQDGQNETRQAGLYANDAWTLNAHFMVGAGLRYDRNTIIDSDGSDLVSHTSPTYSGIARWDFAGDSSRLLTFTAASYSGNYNSSFISSFVKSATDIGYAQAWNANTSANAINGVQFVNLQQLANAANYGQPLYYWNNTKNYAIDPGLTPERCNELTLTYRRTYQNGSFFSIGYVNRRWLDMWAFGQNYDAPDVATLTDPTNSGLPNQYALVTRVFNSNALTRTYNGVELNWMKVFNKTWSMSGSYSYSRLVGNNDDGDTNSSFFNTSTNPLFYFNNALQAQGVPTSAYAPQGQLLSNESNKARLGVTAKQVVGQAGVLSWSLLLNYDSGNPYSAATSAPLNASSFPNLSQFPGLQSPPPSYTQYWGGRGQYTWNDFYSVNAKVMWDLPLGLNKVHLIGDVNISNLFNTQMALYYNNWTNGWSTNPVTTLQPYIPTMYGQSRGLYADGAAWGNSNYLGGRSVKTSIGIKF